MSNNWFRFKQFTIQQDKCGMKVSTDACIQGAWTPILPGVKTVLDIGTGTGLLSLMLAQRNSYIAIDAIELDEAAAQQAKENVSSSPWQERINVKQADVRAYAPLVSYDMLICNPPFFDKSLQSNELNRNVARHAISLSKEDIIATADRLLSDEGYLALMLPPAEHLVMEQLLLEHGWHIFSSLYVVPKQGYEANRVISLATKNKESQGLLVAETLQIKNEDGSYTEQFIQLLRPFYLFL